MIEDNNDLLDSLQKLTPIRGRKLFQRCRLRLEIISLFTETDPDKGTKTITGNTKYSITVLFTETDPDKGTKTILLY